MVRNIILMALAICVLTACNQSDTAQTKIGVVDTARVFRESEPAKAGVNFLESVQKEMQDQLTEMQEKIQKDPTNTAIQQEIQNLYGEFQQRIGAEEQNVVNILQDILQRTVETHRTSKKLDIVVGTELALAYDKSIDITSDVIAEINKKNVEFKSIIPEAPAQEAAPVEEAKAPEAAPAEAEKALEAAPAEAEKATEKK